MMRLRFIFLVVTSVFAWYPRWSYHPRYRHSCEYLTQLRMLSEEDVAYIKQMVPLSKVVNQYTEVKSTGGGAYQCLCPFHDDKRPSMIVTDSKGLYNCFSCGSGGDAITFVRGVESVSFDQAMKIICDVGGIELTQLSSYNRTQPDPQTRQQNSRRLECLQHAAVFFAEELLDARLGRPAVAHVQARQLSVQAAFKFKLGYAPRGYGALFANLTGMGYTPQEQMSAGLVLQSMSPNATSPYYDRFRHRLMIPITNFNGDIVGFGGRDLEDDLDRASSSKSTYEVPKYLNSPETPVFKKSQVLYGYSLARKSISEHGALFVEGYFDVMGLHDIGIDWAVSAMGTALSREQLEGAVRSSPRKLVTLLFDADDAGQRALEKLCAGLLLKISANVEVRIAQLTDEQGRPFTFSAEGNTVVPIKDPGELCTRLGRTRGAAAVRGVLERAEEWKLWTIHRILARCHIYPQQPPPSSTSTATATGAGAAAAGSKSIGDVSSLSRGAQEVVKFICTVDSAPDRTLLVYYAAEVLAGGKDVLKHQLEIDMLRQVETHIMRIQATAAYAPKSAPNSPKAAPRPAPIIPMTSSTPPAYTSSSDGDIAHQGTSSHPPPPASTQSRPSSPFVGSTEQRPAWPAASSASSSSSSSRHLWRDRGSKPSTQSTSSSSPSSSQTGLDEPPPSGDEMPREFEIVVPSYYQQRMLDAAAAARDEGSLGLRSNGRWSGSGEQGPGVWEDDRNLEAVSLSATRGRARDAECMLLSLYIHVPELKAMVADVLAAEGALDWEAQVLGRLWEAATALDAAQSFSYTDVKTAVFATKLFETLQPDVRQSALVKTALRGEAVRGAGRSRDALVCGLQCAASLLLDHRASRRRVSLLAHMSQEQQKFTTETEIVNDEQQRFDLTEIEDIGGDFAREARSTERLYELLTVSKEEERVQTQFDGFLSMSDGGLLEAIPGAEYNLDGSVGVDGNDDGYYDSVTVGDSIEGSQEEVGEEVGEEEVVYFPSMRVRAAHDFDFEVDEGDASAVLSSDHTDDNDQYAIEYQSGGGGGGGGRAGVTFGLDDIYDDSHRSDRRETSPAQYRQQQGVGGGYGGGARGAFSSNRGASASSGAGGGAKYSKKSSPSTQKYSLNSGAAAAAAAAAMAERSRAQSFSSSYSTTAKKKKKSIGKAGKAGDVSEGEAEGGKRPPSEVRIPGGFYDLGGVRVHWSDDNVIF